VSIGRVLGSWGIRGAVKVELLTDFPERFAVGATLWLGGAPRQIERSHWLRGAAVVHLSGIDDPNVASSLRGALVELPESELRALGEDEYYEHDLIGLSVMTAAGEALGAVAQILPTGANEVLIVRGDRGEYLVPLIAEVVQSIDVDARLITIELMQGLEPTPVRRPRPPRPQRGG
jgi:16S rRNA processing protein RimM